MPPLMFIGGVLIAVIPPFAVLGVLMHVHPLVIAGLLFVFCLVFTLVADYLEEKERNR